LNLIGLETESHGSHDVRQTDHVVQLGDHPFRAQPVDSVAGPKIDYVQPAVSLCTLGDQGVIQWQTGNGLIVPRP
jgi:hypothetical protein